MLELFGSRPPEALEEDPQVANGHDVLSADAYFGQAAVANMFESVPISFASDDDPEDEPDDDLDDDDDDDDEDEDAELVDRDDDDDED